jgi:nitroreductase
MPIKKPAELNHKVNELIKNRWSPRAFDDKSVNKDILKSLFEAARWAPSCNNSQPWRFIIAQKHNGDEYNKALTCFNDRNQRWVKNAPVIGFVCAYQFMGEDKKNRTYFYDTGMAMAQFTLQALEHDLYIHQAGGVLLDEVREKYSVPEDVDVVCGFGLGYQGEADILPDELSERELQPRQRNPIDDFVFINQFNNKFE